MKTKDEGIDTAAAAAIGFTPEMIENGKREAARVALAMDEVPTMLRDRYSERYERLKVTVPSGKSGNVEVVKFNVDAQAASFAALRAAFSGSQMGRGVMFPGTYTKLVIGNALVMSDTPDEIDDHMEMIRNARGRVLIHGLGIGMVMRACLLKPDVEHVTVVECNPHVIKLVVPHYRRQYDERRLKIVKGNALTYQWPRGTRWDVVWHDIWDTITEDNLPDMRRLHRRFARRCEWQGSWCRELCSR